MKEKNEATELQEIVMRNQIDKHLLDAEIIDIEWEKIYLTIRVRVKAAEQQYTEGLDFFLVTHFYRANAQFEAKKISDDVYELFMNITNPGYNLALPTGRYTLMACKGDDILAKLTASDELAADIASRSGFFTHNKRQVYAATFRLEEVDDGFYPLMEVWDNRSKGMPTFHKDEIYESAKKKSRLTKIFRKIKGKIKGKNKTKTYMRRYYKYLHKLHRKFRGNKETLLFLSEQAEKLGGNLVCVDNRLRERGLDKNYRILHSAREIVAHPENYGKWSWFTTVTKIAKADRIFVDDHIPMFDWMRLAEDVPLSQLWHAGAGYKASGYIRWGQVGGPSPFSCHRQYRYGIAESTNVAPFHSECFGINTEQVLPTGMPRMDSYLDPEYREKKTAELYEAYPECKDRKVILFAPTFRGNDKSEAHYPYEIIDFDKLYQLCVEKNAVVIFKFHPWIAEQVPIKEEHKDRFLNLGDYPFINDLFYISDVLITDYSSCVFEYSLMRRPCLFFAYDEMQYAYTRGFHRDYASSTPGKICRTFDQLLDALENDDYEFEKMGPYIDFHFDHIDSNSTDRVIDWLILDQIPEEVMAPIKAREEQNARLKAMDFRDASEYIPLYVYASKKTNRDILED
ncbi:MAG: CDP-glycerol glycerophosphotransferase family protein [Eubacteriales bacterium]|nr:CDP-glycerol glycerophosphotransferase family protein [Eubacteriales bacterium]